MFLFPFIATLLAITASWLFARLRKKYSQDLNFYQEQVANMERVLQWRGDLANEIAHEIKNPLTAILCSAETLDLLLADKIEPEHRRSLKFIKEYGSDLLRLVSDFMDVSRAESGHINCLPEAVELQPIAQSVIGLLKASAMKKNIDVKLICQNDSIFGLVDPRHFKQVLFNLLHNALKFTLQNGQITITLQLDIQNKCVAVLVQDNGPGIPKERLPHLFNLYGDRSRHVESDQVGTRVGLSLCKALVELNQGQIAVDSWPGVGTAFCVLLPIANQEVAHFLPNNQRPEFADASVLPLAGQNFLLLEQDAGLREAMSALIRAWGGSVDGVAQATEAVMALAKHEYDAVMVDTDNLNEDHRQLVSKIRQNIKSNETTLILASANKNEELQADKFVSKPLDGQQLLKSLINSGKFQVTH